MFQVSVYMCMYNVQFTRLGRGIIWRVSISGLYSLFNITLCTIHTMSLYIRECNTGILQSTEPQKILTKIYLNFVFRLEAPIFSHLVLNILENIYSKKKDQ